MGFGFESLGHPAQCHQKSPPVRDSFSNPWGIPRSAIKKAPLYGIRFRIPGASRAALSKKAPLCKGGCPRSGRGIALQTIPPSRPLRLIVPPPFAGRRLIFSFEKMTGLIPCHFLSIILCASPCANVSHRSL